MLGKKIPDDPPIQDMLHWIMKEFKMSKNDLTRMFQTSIMTIDKWLNSGKISHKNLKKLRLSYYFLNDMKDPHAGERKCPQCGKWHDLSDFKNNRFCNSCRRESKSSNISIADTQAIPSGDSSKK